MPPETPHTSLPDELERVAQAYADAFNRSPIEDVDGLIADACIDPFYDGRTSLLSMVADEPEDLGLVLAKGPDDYVVVRFVHEWIVDASPVDWERMEERAFAPDPDEEWDQDPIR